MKKILLLLSFLLVFKTLLATEIFYVSTTGNDSNDDVTGKTMSLKLGRQNTKGWKLEHFNSQTPIAHIKTPRGNFEIQMQEAKLAQVAQKTEVL